MFTFLFLQYMRVPNSLICNLLYLTAFRTNLVDLFCNVDIYMQGISLECTCLFVYLLIHRLYTCGNKANVNCHPRCEQTGLSASYYRLCTSQFSLFSFNPVVVSI